MQPRRSVMRNQEKIALQWAIGTALVGVGAYVLYKALRRHSNQTSNEDLTTPVSPLKLDLSGLIPVAEPSAATGPVHFERKHPNPYGDHSHRKYSSEHSTRVGNGPGERNQIGG